MQWTFAGPSPEGASLTNCGDMSTVGRGPRGRPKDPVCRAIG